MRSLAEEFSGYGWERNKGYPTPEHRRALQAFGATPWHRERFIRGMQWELKMDTEKENKGKREQ
jgi:ribonuclease HII